MEQSVSRMKYYSSLIPEFQRIAEWVMENISLLIGESIDITRSLLVFQEKAIRKRLWDIDDSEHIAHRYILLGYLEVLSAEIGRRKYCLNAEEAKYYEHSFENVEIEDRGWFIHQENMQSSLICAEAFKKKRFDYYRSIGVHHKLPRKAEKYFVFAPNDLREDYYRKRKPKSTEFENDFPYLGMLKPIVHKRKSESPLVNITNYITWQKYLDIKDQYPDDPTRKTKKDEIEAGELKNLVSILEKSINMEKKGPTIDTIIRDMVSEYPSWYHEPERSVEESVLNLRDHFDDLVQNATENRNQNVPLVEIGQKNDIYIYIPTDQLIKGHDFFYDFQSFNGDELDGDLETIGVEQEGRFLKLRYCFESNIKTTGSTVVVIGKKPCEKGTYVIIVKGIEILQAENVIRLNAFDQPKPLIQISKAAATGKKLPGKITIPPNNDITNGFLQIIEIKDRAFLSGTFEMVDKSAILHLVLPNEKIITVDHQEDGYLVLENSKIDTIIDLRLVLYELSR
jgi:hypothetical protein